MCDLRDAELAADLVDHQIVFAEDEHVLPGMLREDLFATFDGQPMRRLFDPDRL